MNRNDFSKLIVSEYIKKIARLSHAFNSVGITFEEITKEIKKDLEKTIQEIKQERT